MKNNTIFGAFSTVPANSRLKNGYTLYDWVMRQHGYPEFWGRDISGENVITHEEVAFLHGLDCKIVPLVRNLSEMEISGVCGTGSAMRVIEDARRCGIPEGEGISLNVLVPEDWSINHNWMIGFARTLHSNGYVPGFIGNTDSSKNFNFDRQCSHYVQATRKMNYYDALYGATEPKCEKMPENWTPYCPSALEPEDMQLWVCGKTDFSTYRAENVCALDKQILKNMW